MTYDELFDCILNAKDIVNLKKGMKEFILAYLAMGHDESFVGVLSDDLEKKKDSPIHYLLYSFLNSPESFVDLDFEMFGFEVECDSWIRINKKDSYQLTKVDFLKCLEIFEKRYQLRSSIEEHYELNIVEMELKPRLVTSTCIIKGNVLNILHPRCENTTDKETALSLVLSRTTFMRKKASLEEQKANGKIDDIYSAFGCACNDGWFDLIVNLCTEIEEVYKKANIKPDIIVEQIKEKFGTLRFYFSFEGKRNRLHAIDFLGVGSIRYMQTDNSLHKEIAQIVKKYEKSQEKFAKFAGKEVAFKQIFLGFLLFVISARVKE